MKIVNNLVHACVALALAACLSGCHRHAEKQTLASETLFNDNWEFARSDKAPDYAAGTALTGWEKVQLPHTTRIEDLVVKNQWQGDAWYKKTIVANPGWKNKQVFIRFDSAMNAAEIFLNGKKIASHLGGYLPFTVKLSSALNYHAPNELMVHLDNRDSAITGPKPLKDLDFNTYGGLYRNTYLIIKNDLYISDALAANKTAGGGLFITYPEVSNTKATIQVKANLVNSSSNEKTAHINVQLLDGDKMVAEAKSETQKVSTQSNADISARLTLADPQLWSPQQPHLYNLVTQVFDGDERMVEQHSTRIGIREFSFTPDHHLLINGKQTFLTGVNRHQEYPYVGYATSDAADYRDAVRIKSAGFDYVRLSHYPHSPAFMDAADELGLVVLDSVLGWQYFSEDPAFQAHIQQTCRDLIRRDRNHPSVLAWECSLNESWMSEPFIDSLTKIVHEEYPSAHTYSAGWQEYGYDIYLQARQHRLKDYHTPSKPYDVSEYGDWEYYAMNAGLNQTAWGNLLQADRSSRQLLGDDEVRLLQQATNIQEAHNDNFNTPAFADGYWVMFDYNRGYSPDLESSGVMSIDRLPKYSYYFFQSQRNASEHSEKYTSGPMVYIASEWNEKSPLNVRVFSNTEQVELLLNGKSLGKQYPDDNATTTHLQHPPFTFAVKSFSAGELKAVGYINDKPVAEYKVSTPDKATQLTLALDTSGKAPQAGVKDIVFARAQLRDEAGHISHENNVPVKFEVTGNATLVSPPEVNTLDGVASALIQIGGSATGINIKANAEDITEGNISL